jgi:membrane protease YdiL (CAAX protease family)
MIRAIRLAVLIYVIDLLVVSGVVIGWIPFHPILLMVPLVGLLNYRVEKRSNDGLGLTTVDLLPALAVAGIFAVLTLGRYVIALRLAGIPLRMPMPTLPTVLMLIWIVFVDIFIIALYEEIVNRGFIQTRLQASWGFSGVLIATIMFVSLHIPSAVKLMSPDPAALVFRLLQVGLVGFLVAFVYWRTESVVPTIAIHGLSNVSYSLSQQLSGQTGLEIITTQIPIQFLWLVVQVGFVLWVADRFFPRDGPA